MASIARAFTMRRKRVDSGVDVSTHEDVPSPVPTSRSQSMRHNKRSVDIKKISGPVQLLSTTNMLTYNAPDVSVIQAQRKASSSVSSGSSAASVDDDTSSTSSRFRDTHLTDASSVGSISPVASPNEKNMAFFESAPASATSSLRRSVSTVEMRHQSISQEELSDLPPRSESPAIPQRHPSHSKRAHTELARKRSMQTMSTSSMTRSHTVANSASSRREASSSSIDYFNGESIPTITTTPAATPPAHPFGKELEQLDEVAEEFSVVANDAEREHDQQVMRQRGLARFCAADYLAEIQPLFSSYVHTHLSAPQVVGWI